MIIDDPNALLEKNTETYSLMDKYMAFSRRQTAANTAVSGSLTGRLAMGDSTNGTSLGYSGSFTGVQSGSRCDMDIKMKASGSAVEDGRTMTLEALGVPASFDMLVRADGESGDMALRSDALLKLLGSGLTDTWVTTNGELLGLSDPADPLNIGDKGYTTRGYLYWRLRTEELSSVSFTGSDLLAAFSGQYADSAFTRSGSDYTSTHTDPDSGTTWTVTLTVSGDSVVGCRTHLLIPAAADADDDSIGVDSTMSVTADGQELAFSLRRGSELSYDLTLSLKASAAAASATGAPETGAKTVSLEELLAAREKAKD